MDEAREGVDWVTGGADVSPYLLLVLLGALAVPVALLAFLMGWVL